MELRIIINLGEFFFFFLTRRHLILCLAWLKQIGRGGWGRAVVRRRWGGGAGVP